MARESLKTAAEDEQSPALHAKARLKTALGELERVVKQRLKDAATAEAAASDDSAWRETVDALESETRSLKAENAQLAEALKTSKDNTGDEKAQIVLAELTQMLDETIASVETILKDK